MIIENIKMENFKSHVDTEMDLSTGITTLMGPNGSGKTSILEAISFALFKQYTSKKIDQLITTGATKMKVQVTFTVDGRTYKVTRERTSTTKADMKILEGDQFQPLVAGDKQVTEEVQNILEMDGDLFLNAVYVRQGEIADLIDKTPAEKKQMIGRLLGIDSLEKAWKNMKLITEKYETQSTKLEGRLEAVESLNGEHIIKTTTMATMVDEASSVEKDLQESIIECQLTKEKKEILDQRATEYNNLTSNIEGKNLILIQYEETHDELEADKAMIEDKENEIKRIKPQLPMLDSLNKILNLSVDLEWYEGRAGSLQMNIEKIEKVQEIIKDTQSSHSYYGGLVDRIADLENDRKTYEGSKSLYLDAQRREEDLKSEISLNLVRISEAMDLYNNIAGTDCKTIAELESIVKTAISEINEEIGESAAQIQDKEKYVSILTMKNEGLEKPIRELENITDSCPICKSTITPEKQKELLENYNSEIYDNGIIIQDLTEEIEVLNFELSGNRQGLDKLLEIEISPLKARSELIEKDKKELLEISANVQELHNKAVKLEEIDKALKTHKEQLEVVKEKNEKYLAAKGSLESLGNKTELEKELQDVNKSIEENKNAIFDLKVPKNVVDNIHEEIKNLVSLQEKCQRMEGEVSQKDSILKRLQENKDNITETGKALAELNQKLEQLNYNSDVHERIRADWELKNTTVNDLTARKHSLLGQLEQLSQSIKELEQKLESYKELEGELKRLKDFLKLLYYIRDIYGKDGVQRELRNLSRPLIEDKTRELFERFNFEYSDIRLDENYDVSIYGPGGESNLDMISGGEKIAVALALRLGITQVLSGGNLELIMLDEPTIHLDSYRRQELVELLKKMSILPQMIIVTHDDDLEEAADNILRISKDGGDSAILEV